MAQAHDASEEAETRGVARFGGRAVLGGVALLLGAVPFGLLTLLVTARWTPILEVDREVAGDLNELANDSPLLLDLMLAITTLGNTVTVVVLFLVAVAVCLFRGRRRLAAFVAVTGVGLAVLIPLSKELIDRTRPVVSLPVTELPTSGSFPSGHAMGSLVGYGMLALLLVPVVRRGLRAWLVTAAVLVVAAVSLSRLFLGVHFLTDVVGGWALGAGWLAVTTASFRAWQHGRGKETAEPLDPLEAAEPEATSAGSRRSTAEGDETGP